MKSHHLLILSSLLLLSCPKSQKAPYPPPIAWDSEPADPAQQLADYDAELLANSPDAGIRRSRTRRQQATSAVPSMPDSDIMGRVDRSLEETQKLLKEVRSQRKN